MEIRIHKSGPVIGDFSRNLGIAVSRQVRKKQFGPWLSRLANLIKIYAARSPRSIAGAGQLRAHERVDHTRFSNVGTSEKGNLRHAGGREMRQVARREHESRQNPHTDSF